MIKKMTMVAVTMLIALFMAGASAAADVVIKPDSGPNVDVVSGAIYVPIGADAAVSVGLGVDYSGFAAGNYYTQSITDPGSVVVPGTPSSGGLPTGNDFMPIHWTPSLSDKGKTFTINAEAITGSGLRKKTIIVTAPGQPVPELPTGILAAAGLIGLVGLVRYRGKNN